MLLSPLVSTDTVPSGLIHITNVLINRNNSDVRWHQHATGGSVSDRLLATQSPFTIWSNKGVSSPGCRWHGRVTLRAVSTIGHTQTTSSCNAAFVRITNPQRKNMWETQGRNMKCKCRGRGGRDHILGGGGSLLHSLLLYLNQLQRRYINDRKQSN